MLKDMMNDLVFSEMSIAASSNIDSFEIRKLHQLFQSNYLINVGDYKSALQSYYEIIKLFENNKHLWADPPVYYVSALEGILDNLRGIKKYDGMPYFIEQLRGIRHSSVNFRAEVAAIAFLYELFPLLDTGDFRASLSLVAGADITEKAHLLSLTRQAEIYLYTALVHFANKEFRNARKSLLQVIIRGKSFYFLPLYRTIRLINLMVRFETGDFETIPYEIRSIKREISKTEKAYRTEHLMLNFMNQSAQGILPGKQEKFRKKTMTELEELRNDIFEKQILKLFDFTAWIESKLRHVSLQKVLSERNEKADVR